ncbi:MAG TPA: AmmeMemoRadiSam system protein A [Acidimicrobiales bacterium]|nr:AmmeMemoRadiSam system protein A [Acidimicrobiales bacterium]
MAPSPSADAALTAQDAGLLLDIADAAIVEGLFGGPPSVPPLALLPAALRQQVGVFVTLTVDGDLNGCIGTIEGEEPLGHGTARHARSAAFADPRLPALRRADYQRLTTEVSVLSPLAPVAAASRQRMLEQLRPGTDGLVIALGARRGVFLPAVWDQLADPEAFLDHLQVKAGLPPGWWHDAIRAWRFTATKFARRSGERPNSSQAA